MHLTAIDEVQAGWPFRSKAHAGERMKRLLTTLTMLLAGCGTNGMTEQQFKKVDGNHSIQLLNYQLDKYAQETSQQQPQNFAVSYVAGQVKYERGDVVPV
jgi:hypothetical protein